jgi:hypothetical protein
MGINKVKSRHQRLGHFNNIRLHQLMFVSIGLIIFKKMFFFFFFGKTCVESKQQTNKFPKLGGIRATLLLGIVHLDVCGNVQIPINSGCCYFITFIDDFS